MNDQVDEVKSKVDIVSIIGERIELKKAGRNYKALCPFHSEKSPSFMVSSELQMYKCFGCSEGGDVFTFLEKYEGMEFAEALKYLADRVGVKLVSFRSGEAGEKEKLYEINTWASKFYNYLLLGHRVGKPALTYLTKERGLTLNTIKTFQIGFSPDVSDALVKFLVGKKKFNIRDIERSGIISTRDGRSFDRFRGRIIFPLFDHKGNVVGFAGRILPWVKGDLAKYINTPETPIYHKGNLLFGLNLTKDEVKRTSETVIVEGELDAISSWQAGIRNVAAIKGSALTEDQVRLISRFAKKLVLALDSDLAGDAAARRGVTIAQEAGLEVTVAKLTGSKDPDEAARKDAGGYKKALKNAANVWDFIIESVFSKFDALTGEGKAKISREIVPTLVSISDKIVQAHYIEVVAKKLGIASEFVYQEMEKTTTHGFTSKQEEIEKPKLRGRRELLEESFLALAFQSDPKILSDASMEKLILTPLAKRIFEEYKSFSGRKDGFDPAEFVHNLPGELVGGFSEMVLKDLEEVVHPEKLSSELTLIKKELTILDLKQKLTELGKETKELEEADKKEELRKIQKKFAIISEKLSSLEEQL